jgi:hypothetical protein
VPAAEFVLGATSLWDVIYEHRSIFSTPALRRLFEDASFRVLDMGRSFGGQYLWIEAVPAPSPPRSERDERALAELGSLAQAFGRRLEASLERWRRELERHRSRGPVALWGAGSKGVTFLNLVGSEAVSSVVDVNPRKQRMHVAGTGHRVEPPAHLVDARPDVVVLLNPVYAAEVTQMLRAHSLRPLVLTP